MSTARRPSAAVRWTARDSAAPVADRRDLDGGSYRIAEVELSCPPEPLALRDGETGIALLVRRHGRPVGFVMSPWLGPIVLTAPTVADLAHQAASHGDPGTGAPAITVTPDPATLPSLTVAVCTRDRSQKLARCLASLMAFRRSPLACALRLELLVVDNAPSNERTHEVVASFPGIRYVHAPVRGLDVARNHAIESARGDFVAFFDDDVTVDPGWLAGFAEACTEHPDAAAVTGPVLPSELLTRAQILFEEYGGFGHRFRKVRFGRSLDGNPLYPCAPGLFGAGCNMALRRRVVQQLGGFDDALDAGSSLPGGGDLDIFYRIVRAGHVLVTEPRCLVFHQHRRTYAELRRQMWSWGLGYMAFVVKSWTTDPAARPKFRRLVPRWFGRRLAALGLSALGVGDRPPGLAVAQLLGGVVGLLGEYPRSVRRIRRLHALQASTLSLPVESAAP